VLGGVSVTVVPLLPRDGARVHSEGNSAVGKSPGVHGDILAPRPVMIPAWERGPSNPIGRPLRQVLRFMLLRRELDRWEREIGGSIDLVVFAGTYDWEFDFVGPRVDRLLGRE
jgi:hypothetical protein